jgi:hypothetical protein
MHGLPSSLVQCMEQVRPWSAASILRSTSAELRGMRSSGRWPPSSMPTSARGIRRTRRSRSWCRRCCRAFRRSARGKILLSTNASVRPASKSWMTGSRAKFGTGRAGGRLLIPRGGIQRRRLAQPSTRWHWSSSHGPCQRMLLPAWRGSRTECRTNACPALMRR